MSITGRHHIISLRELGGGTFVLRFTREGLVFEPGQYIHVGPLPGIDRREYSVYSPVNDDALEILVKDVPRGAVSPRLHELKEGDLVDVEGPFGFFRIDEADRQGELVFLATGTGISPFHCLTGSYPGLNYRLIHGVRTLDERHDHHQFEARRIVSCVSREDGGDRRGRVTDWLKEHPPGEDSLVFLCGNCDMIYDAYDILRDQGVEAHRIHAEVYF